MQLMENSETFHEICAEIVCDSVSEAGKRLTTLQLSMPRFLLAQFNTHRQFSRNAASSRAIPTAKLIERVREQPFIPTAFAANQKGMQAGDELEAPAGMAARLLWRRAAEEACRAAEEIAAQGVHKQWANRLLEPFLMVKVLVSSTEWDNFFRLRLHEDAQPEFQAVAAHLFAALHESVPQEVKDGEWHLPYVSAFELKALSERDLLRPASVARCARLGLAKGTLGEALDNDIELFERLKSGSGFGHWSPFEHVARPVVPGEPHLQSNFRGWHQFRKEFPGECA